MGKKPPPEGICKHPHCRESILYSDFAGAWVHLRTLAAPCPNNTVAEPEESAPASNYSPTYGTGSLG